jgi:hypothetical protein
MRLFRHLQHWLGGSGPHLQVANAVPRSHAMRPWADTLPWAALVKAVEHSFARRFPPGSPCGRRPISTRVFLALELLKHAGGASDEEICERLRTDVAVMYACGLDVVQLESPQAHCVLPETLAQLRSRLDQPRMDELRALQAAAAMDEGLVSPAHLLIDPFPSAQGSPRVTEATTLSKAPKKRSSGLHTCHNSATAGPHSARATPTASIRSCTKPCGALAAKAEGKATAACNWCAKRHTSSLRLESPSPR